MTRYPVAAAWVLLIKAFSLSTDMAGVGLHVNTTSGMVRGMISAGVYTYLGLPYAASPIEERRFRPTELKEYVHQEHDGTHFGPICPQVIIDFGADFRLFDQYDTMSEDCLTLNLYVPLSASHDNRRAVMVWIHGGGYIGGNGNVYNASQIVGFHDVIVVTINYRIGILGFLCTMDDNAPGNLGLRDQILALEWVQLNIEGFGGDKDRVTIFGESAGGGSVTQLSLSPMSRGLFRRIIAQSGSPFAPWASVKNPIQVAKDLSEGLSCPTSSTASMVDCLRGKTVEQLLQSQKLVFTANTQLDWAPAYGDTFLPFTSLDEVERNSETTPNMRIPLYDIDMMTGLCTEEGGTFYNFIMMGIRHQLKIDDDRDGITEDLLDEILRPLIEALTRGTRLSPNLPRTLMQYKYTDWTRPDNGISRAVQLVKLLSDVNFNIGSVEFARLHVRLSHTVNKVNSDSPTDGATYFYRFNQRGSWMSKRSWRPAGADHADDLFFVFGYPLTEHVAATSEEKKFSSDVMTYWTNFAKTGNPNRPDSPVEWPRYNTETEEYLDLDTNLSENSVKSRFNADRIAFWTQFIPEQIRLVDKYASSCDNREEPSNSESSSSYRQSDISRWFLPICYFLCIYRQIFCD